MLSPALSEIDNGVKDSRRARGVSETTHFGSSFEQANAFFENIVRRIHQAGVDVSQFLECEEVGGVFGRVESESGGPVYRDGT